MALSSQYLAPFESANPDNYRFPRGTRAQTYCSAANAETVSILKGACDGPVMRFFDRSATPSSLWNQAARDSGPLDPPSSQTEDPRKRYLVPHDPQCQQCRVLRIPDPYRGHGTAGWQLRDGIERIHTPQWSNLERQAHDREFGERCHRAR